MASPGTSRRIDPVCGTCRKKCRKCDRTKPVCKRCESQGLVCEGYALNIKMYDMEAGTLKKSKPKGRQRAARTTTIRQTLATSPNETESSPSGSSQHQETFGTPSEKYEDAFATRNLVASLPLSGRVSSQDLLSYYQSTVCPQLSVAGINNLEPFETFILPLAYEQPGLLKAVLGLSACHLAIQGVQPDRKLETVALQHRLAAIQSLSSLLLKGECLGLSEAEEETALAIVLMLVLHDIFESGKSMHGAHLNGVSFLCYRLTERAQELSPSQNFLVTALTWFDLLRGFSGAEKLAFSPEVHRAITSTTNPIMNSLVGCPIDIFIAIGDTLSAGKQFRAREIDEHSFQIILDEILHRLQTWDPLSVTYPNQDAAWAQLGDAYRHAAILRVMRFPDTFLIPCSDVRIKSSVEAILDASAKVPRLSLYFKRFLFPLFVAGAETTSPHQQQYVLMSIERIRAMTGVEYHSVHELLERTWEDRAKSDGSRNVPWFEYTCSESLPRQHDYIFF